MSNYVIGDIQGCYSALIALLDKIHFNPKKDHLYFVGDLINRGPESLQTLRFIHSLEKSATAVLGNHDIHLLAVAEHIRPLHPSDTLIDILQAPDKEKLLYWLRHCPLLYFNSEIDFAFVHAGIPPFWTIEEACQLSSEVELQLRASTYAEFLKEMFGNQPCTWSQTLTSNDRHRFILNAFTRMRYLHEDLTLDFTAKDAPYKNENSQLKPWFSFSRKSQCNIAFGHWAALKGQCDAPNCYALDYGCAWGEELAAMNLNTFELYSVNYHDIYD